MVTYMLVQGYGSNNFGGGGGGGGGGCVEVFLIECDRTMQEWDTLRHRSKEGFFFSVLA